MANSVDPDEPAHNEPSHLDLHCLRIQLFASPWLKVLWHSSYVFCYVQLKGCKQTVPGHLNYSKDEHTIKLQSRNNYI